ncbi:MAG: type II toxin-antitoxin system VapC family toxin [Acidobacteriota bacterium]|nr:type II toxin-antitoxin system VapC family toxin [Acidobacteriota bacterium]
MVVVDASAVVEILLNRAIGSRVRERLFHGGQTIHAPQLIDIEVLHVIRRYNRKHEMTDASAEDAVAIYSGLPIERHSHEVVLRRAWELRSNLTAYGAAYVALAELLDVRLVTTDKRLAKAAPHVAELIQ